MPGLGVCGPSGASNTRLSWPLGSMDCRNKSALAVKLRFSQYQDAGPWEVRGSWGPQQHTSAGPCGALYRRGVKKDPRTHSPKGRGLDLVDDGTRSRGRGRLDVMGFLEQVRTSCGPQSLSKSRMPGLGVCGRSGASKSRLSWPLGSIALSEGQTGPPDTPPQEAWARLG